MEVEVNYISVLVAVVASMAVGFMWYSPMLFGTPWMKLMGYSEASLKKDQQNMGKLYGTSFVLAIVTAFVLTHVIAFSMSFYGYSALQTGITSAFWMWLGFVMPVQATDVLFSKRPWQLFAINTGYQLASLVVMGVVLGML